jgi:PhnB protein
MSFDPYLHFSGNCREAMMAYQAIFGGDLQLSPYAEAPDAPPAFKDSDRIMHAALTVGGRMLMASDFPPSMPSRAQAAVTISHMAASESEGRRLFDLLVAGGEIVMPFQPTFWSDGFGMLKDRFGTHWMVSAPWRQPEAG